MIASDAPLVCLDCFCLRALGSLPSLSTDDPLTLPFFLGYPDHMVFSEFRRRFDVLTPHLTKKHGRHYIVTDEKRVSVWWGSGGQGHHFGVEHCSVQLHAQDNGRSSVLT